MLPLMVLLALSIVVALPSSSLPRSPTSETSGPDTTRTYDFIVLGCGGAGAVAATRLAGYSSKNTVLCLERGQEPTGYSPAIQATFAEYTQVAFFNSLYSFDQNQYAFYQYSTDPTSLPITKPGIPGGGTRINGNAFQRPSRDDMEAFHSPLWTFDAVNDDWKYIERYNGTSGLPWHGYHGHEVTNQFPPDAIATLIANSAIGVFDLYYNPDSSSGRTGGVSILIRNIAIDPDNASIPIRQNTYTNFLEPALLRHRNLHVEFGAVALKILVEGRGKYTVIYTKGGLEYRVRSRKELVLSLGNYGSPKLLLNSGIGNCTELAGVQIPCVISQPEVGKHHNEGSLLSMAWIGPAPTDLAGHIGNVMQVHYKGAHFHPEAAPTSPTNDQFINMELEFASFPLSDLPVAQRQAILAAKPHLHSQPGLYVYFWTIAQRKFPHKGRVALKDNNPLSDPRVVLNLYPDDTIPDTIDAFRGVRTTMTNVGLFEEIIPGTTIVPLDASNDTIASWILSVYVPEIHYSGTNLMHKVVNDRGVLAPGLRVADNSIIYPLATHGSAAQAATVGAVIARLIAEDWGLCGK
jgi:choline dehydrogenase